MNKQLIISIMLIASPLAMHAQQTLSLEECRQMAVSGNREIEQARQKLLMAEYDKKTARANYFPEISATGAYLYNSRNIALISSETSDMLGGMGTAVQGQISGQMQQLMQAITSNPAAAAEYMKSPMWQTVLGALSKTDVSNALNALGSSIDEAFQIDMQNVYAGVVSLKQPIFMGGKIIASNKMATLAEQLAQTQLENQYQDVLITVDQNYWQIVSIANKKKLAETYSELLEHMLHNAEISVAEGVAVQSDLLSIKVKHNEAKMLLSKSVNGLALAKMLLCKQIGLPLDSDITLVDESADAIPQPQMLGSKPIDEVIADRTETRSLELASRIYEQKEKIARADMLPKLAVTANYIVSNPSVFNGFNKDFGGMFNAGVVLSVPLFHGTEALQKTRKAKAEAQIYRSRYEDAKDMINLQVEQLTKQQSEAYDKLMMAESNLDNAEENLRTAMAGFEEGVISTDVTLAAQAAWMQAHSEFIDAGIELQMNHVNLMRAQGNYKSSDNK